MPKGSKWTKAETIALVEAFVHISEDAIVGVNQAADTLYLRIVEEAKSRYAGEWRREPAACKSRWHIVSRNVQKFIAIELVVQSVPRSGWSDEQYYKAAVMAFHKAEKPEMNMDEVDPDSLSFDFKDEWEILKDHEKWRTSFSKHEQNQRQKRNSFCARGSESDDNNGDSDEVIVVDRPTGMKKAKSIQGMNERRDSLMLELKRQKTQDNSVIFDMIGRMEAQGKQVVEALETANDTMKMLKDTVSESTNKLSHSLTHALNMKNMMRADVSTMSIAVQQTIKLAREKHLENAALLEIAKYGAADGATD